MDTQGDGPFSEQPERAVLLNGSPCTRNPSGSAASEERPFRMCTCATLAWWTPPRCEFLGPCREPVPFCEDPVSRSGGTEPAKWSSGEFSRISLPKNWLKCTGKHGNAFALGTWGLRSW